MASQLKRLLHLQEEDVTGSGNPLVAPGVSCSTTGDVRLIVATIIAQETATATNTVSQIVRALVTCDATTPSIVGSNNATKIGAASPAGTFSLAVSGTTVRAELTNGAGSSIKMQVTYQVFG